MFAFFQIRHISEIQGASRVPKPIEVRKPLVDSEIMRVSDFVLRLRRDCNEERVTADRHVTRYRLY